MNKLWHYHQGSAA